MKTDFRVGCCGFGVARERYFQQFQAVEVQNTFYQPPQLVTLEKWRKESPNDFEFAIKAWQLITHESKSPTYRRLGRSLTAKESTECGAFRNSPIVHEAWQKTLECAQILGAKSILFQCPASLKQTDENLENMRIFFRSIETSSDIDLFWEPRGQWDANVVRSLCTELSIYHAVDPFVTESVTPAKAYYRLHGRTGWRHNFSDEELSVLWRLSQEQSWARIYFNNVTMIDDALRFKEILGRCSSAIGN